jgi:hypothetical protein
MELNSFEIKNEKITKKIKSILIIHILIAGFLIPLNSSFYLVAGVSTWTQTSDKDFDNGTSNNLTMIGIGEDAELQIDLSELTIWKQQKPNISPNKMSYHTMSSIYGEDKVLLVGGYDGDYNNETWIYDVSDNTWSEKKINPKPSARLRSAMAPVFGTKKVVLFGGYTGIDNNNTWVYDLNNNTWTNMTPSNHPHGMRGHVMASIYGQDKVILYSGYYLPGIYPNETWIYDLSDNNWTLQSPDLNPGSMMRHAMASVWNQDKVILYTSWSNPGETWVYDFSTDNWTERTPANSPPSRIYSSISSISGTDSLLLFGGYINSNNHLDDTWKYDYSDNRWSQVTLRYPTNKPAKRYAHKSASIIGTDKILLFGGSDASKVFNDTWIYEDLLPTKNGTYLPSPFDTGAKSDFNTISWYSNEPVNTNIKLQVRTATTESFLTAQTFVGPDGTATSFYSSSPKNLWQGHDGDRWIQFQVYFNISVVKTSPSLKDVTISYNCLPNTIVISPVNGTILTNNQPTFIWTFEDYDSEKQNGFQVLIDDDYNFTNIDFNSGEQNTATELWIFPTGTNYNVLPDGIWYWKVRTKDPDGVWTEFSNPRKILIDTQIPTSAPTFPENNGYYYNVQQISGIANDVASGTGINRIEIAIQRLKNNDYWNGTNWVSLQTWVTAIGTTDWIYYSSEVDWTSGNRYSVRSRAIDNANNVEETTNVNIFAIDSDRPISNINYPINDIWLNELNTISGISYDLSGSGVDRVEIFIKCSEDYIKGDNGPKKNQYWSGTTWTPNKAWLLTIGTTKWSYSASEIPWTTGDEYTIQSRAIDNTNNIEVPDILTTFMYDRTPPENLEIIINNDTEYIANTSIILSLQAQDIGSGTFEMSFSSDSSLWSEWEPFKTTRSFELDAGDGKKTIYFRVRDFTGNIAESVFDSIVLDTTPPKGLSIIIEDNSKYTNSRNLKLYVQATDKLSGVSEVSFSYYGVNWLNWESFTQTKYLLLPNDIRNGEIRISFRAKDKVGNIANSVFDSIILDTIPPYSLSISINEGQYETNSTSVKLTLTAFDNTSGISQVSFSDDNELWSYWEDFDELRFYDISPGNGEKTIYMKIKDNAGNIAGPISGTINLNITKPQKQDQPTKSPTAFDLVFWMIILMITVIIIIMLISAIVVSKRKKRSDQELLSHGALTIRPGRLAGQEISLGEITQAPKLQQLPTTTTPLPMIAKSIQTQAGVPQHTPSVQQLPQLPPAKTQEKTPEISSTSTTAKQTSIQPQTPPSFKTSTPSSNRVGPQGFPIPTIASSKRSSSGPEVHLPNMAPQPAIVSKNQPNHFKNDGNTTSEQLEIQMKSKPTHTPQIAQQTKKPNMPEKVEKKRV